MARIPESFVQDLLNRVDIVDVVERYLPLKKAGQNLSACCPFHKEKSPSFTVSPTKQFYHCFGCGAHGSAVSFVMEYQGVNFPEAVRILAESVGMQVPVEEGVPNPAEKKGPGLLDILATASDFYRAQLKLAPVAITYLKGRGVVGLTAAKFGIGYAPGGDDWQALKQVFADYDWNKLLPEAGLVIEKEETKRRYDRFRDRVLFPIQNQRGQVIGFGGRIMGAGEPKYLNSPETPVFEKGRELYGLPQARAAIRERGRVMVVEGYMDVVMLHQHGVEYAVATLGTACTPEHIKKLLKLADEVVFCFDGDAAGRRAAWRGLENSLPEVTDGKELRFLFLPAEHDPDSYVQEFGREGFENFLTQEALPLSQYLLRELSAQVDLAKEEGRAKLLHIAQPYLERMSHAPALQMMLKKRLAELCQITANELDSLRVPARKSTDARSSRTVERDGANKLRPRGVVQGKRPQQSPQAQLLGLVLFKPDLVASVEPEWRNWPAGAGELAVAVLDAARENPRLEGMVLVEAWRETVDFERLMAWYRDACQTFEKFTEEELVDQFSSTLAAARQSLARPSVTGRKTELDFRRANGGLTEAEKAEYLSLIARK
ncbi:MAG: DNA primase [Formivibrio sp.]|nr:DNA primase [Formivibrio sp.]